MKNQKNHFVINSYGYTNGQEFTTKKLAIDEMKIRKIQDMAACKRSFRMATFKGSIESSFRITFGINLYSAHSIKSLD